MRVANAIPFGCQLPLTVTTVNHVATLKADLGMIPKMFAYEHPTLKTPIISIVFCSTLTAGMAYFNFTTIVQVGVVIYSMSLFLEWGSVIIFRYSEPDMRRPFVIPMRNGFLTIYFTIPMGLCLFTAFSVVQNAVQQIQEGPYLKNTTTPDTSNPDYQAGIVACAGIGGVLVVAISCYYLRKMLRGDKGKCAVPPPFHITRNRARHRHDRFPPYDIAHVPLPPLPLQPFYTTM
jgi:amino acid transporter